MQPQIATFMCGFFFLRWLILPSRPNVLWSALSLTVQVLKITKSASSDSDGANPDLIRIPISFSESLAFIWQPKVTVHAVSGLPASSDLSAISFLSFPI